MEKHVRIKSLRKLVQFQKRNFTLRRLRLTYGTLITIYTQTAVTNLSMVGLDNNTNETQ